MLWLASALTNTVSGPKAKILPSSFLSFSHLRNRELTLEDEPHPRWIIMGDLYASTGSSLGPLMLKLSRGVPGVLRSMGSVPFRSKGGRITCGVSSGIPEISFLHLQLMRSSRALLAAIYSRVFRRNSLMVTASRPIRYDPYRTEPNRNHVSPWSPPVLLMMEIWKYRRFNNCNIIGSSISQPSADFCPRP